MKWLSSRPQLHQAYSQCSSGESDHIIRAIGGAAVRGDINSAIDLVYLFCFPLPGEPGGRVQGIATKFLEAILERDSKQLLEHLDDHFLEWARVDANPQFYYLLKVIPEKRFANSFAFPLLHGTGQKLLPPILQGPSHPYAELLLSCFLRLSPDFVSDLEGSRELLEGADSRTVVRLLNSTPLAPRGLPNLTLYFLKNHGTLTKHLTDWMVRCAPLTWPSLNEQQQHLLLSGPGCWSSALSNPLPHGGTYLARLKTSLPEASQDIYHRCANPDLPWSTRRLLLIQIHDEKPPGDQTLLPLDTPLGWEALLEVLGYRQDWSRLKEISWKAPPEWSVRALQCLKRHRQSSRLLDCLSKTRFPIHRREPPKPSVLFHEEGGLAHWTPDGRHRLLFPWSESILVFNPDSNWVVDSLTCDHEYINWRFSKNMRWLAGGTYDLRIWAWPPGPENERSEPVHHLGPSVSAHQMGVEFSEDSSRLAYSPQGEDVCIFDLQEGREVQKWPLACGALAWLTDGSILLACEGECQWRGTDSGALLGRRPGDWEGFRLHQGKVLALSQHALELWSFGPDWQCRESYPGLHPSETTVHLNEDHIVLSSLYKTRVLSRESGQVEASLEGRCLGTFGTGTNLAMLNQGKVNLWSPKTQMLVPATGSALKAELADCGVIAISTKETLEVWAAWPLQKLWTHPTETDFVSLSPCGHHLYTSSGWLSLICDRVPGKAEPDSFLHRLAGIRKRLSRFEDLNG